MGRKVNPIIFRTGVILSWNSKWFASKKNYKKSLRDDYYIRQYLRKELKESGVAKIDIERSANAVTISIHAAKPGFIIGRGGEGVEKLKKNIQRRFLDRKTTFNVNIQEVDQVTISAPVIAQQIAADIEKRIPYRRVLKQAIGRVERGGAQGVKIVVAGRLNGAEIARTEKMVSGKIPLHTLRANIDYAKQEASTIYGVIGIKVWVYKGEVFDQPKEK